jgi:probable HAF family extracellular repeat protein
MTSERTREKKALFLCLILFPLFVATSALAQQYQVTAIEPPAGYTASRAMGINNLGQVVGRFYNMDPATGNALDRRAFVWDRANGAVLLPTLNGESSAWAINDNGFVSGYSYASEAKQHAAVWDSDANITDIGTLVNGMDVAGDESTAYGINRYGEVVGSADIPNDDGSFMPFHAFYYNERDGIYDLRTLTTSWPEWANGYSIAYDINNYGEIVGIAHDSDWNFLPFIDDETNGMEALQIDPAYANGEWYAVVINDFGLIGGHVIAVPNQSLPFYWPDKSSAPVKITMPNNFPYGEIYGINASGQMVGIMWDTDQEGATERAFIFDQQKGVRDLNDLIDATSGWVLTFSRDINENGQVVGYGEYNGQKRGFLLDAQKGLVVDFGDEVGLYIYDGMSWAKMHPGTGESMVAFGSELYVDFGAGVGLYRHGETGWEKVNSNDAHAMCVVGSDLYVDFADGIGLYRYDGIKWQKVHPGPTEEMIGVGSELYVDFGAGVGLYRYDGTGWKRINGNDARRMCTVGRDLVVDFGSGVGLYRYDGVAWEKLSPGPTEGMLAVGSELYVDFGAGGLYSYGATGWKRVNPNDAHAMCVVGSDLYVDFANGIGLYKYDGLKWQKVHPGSAEEMIGVDSDLYVDFGSSGMYRYSSGQWTKVNGNNPKNWSVVNLK